MYTKIYKVIIIDKNNEEIILLKYTIISPGPFGRIGTDLDEVGVVG